LVPLVRRGDRPLKRDVDHNVGRPSVHSKNGRNNDYRTQSDLQIVPDRSRVIPLYRQTYVTMPCAGLY
jgi:hypothetical protein